MPELPHPDPERYPESDGAPMGETGIHAFAVHELLSQLYYRYGERDDVYVGGNQFLYYQPGDAKQVVCPDLYVVFGRPRRPLRRTWKLWEEDGHAPDLIIEITSMSTRLTDTGAKLGLYAALGVKEYVLFDPLGDYLQPPLQGYRLEGGRYVAIDPSPAGVHLETVGLWLRADGVRAKAWQEDGTKAPDPLWDGADTAISARSGRSAFGALQAAGRVGILRDVDR